MNQNNLNVSFSESLKILEILFGKDCQFALATSTGNVPTVRFVDLLYMDKAFYLVTYAKSQKVLDLQSNPNFSISKNLYRFNGRAVMLGHPLDEKNKEIRSILTDAFSEWYFEHNNENDENMCYVKLCIDTGFFYKDGVGYKLDMYKESVDAFPFSDEIEVTL